MERLIHLRHYIIMVKLLRRFMLNNENFIYPDSVVGTDSHTTMVNALSVLGWGVGGIEAEAAMLGEPISFSGFFGPKVQTNSFSSHLNDW